MDSVQQFLANVMSLVDAMVSAYQIAASKHDGVVRLHGGQHRSVYMAEHWPGTARKGRRGGLLRITAWRRWAMKRWSGRRPGNAAAAPDDNRPKA